VSYQIRNQFMIQLKLEAEIIIVFEEIDICRDPKDNKFLEVAVNGKADFIITGDKDLLVLNPFQGIEIITVNEFLSRFNLD
ncbi:putative toxin-antitoxin system toxin component, PIN family, partial [Crocosphaera sp.]